MVMDMLMEIPRIVEIALWAKHVIVMIIVRHKSPPLDLNSKKNLFKNFDICQARIPRRIKAGSG